MATSMIGRHQASSSSSSSSVQKRWYDVFISYRGEDTGKNFTDHLYSRLNATGINTFRDKNELKRGKKISPELLKAIHESKICIIVFSRNYATSKWCLNELVEIIKCRKQFSQLVLPIFYKVKPSDVRKQTGSFGEAFVKHDDDQKVNRNKVSSWRAALAEAGELSGWDLDATDGCEGDFINKIVDKISRVLNHTYLHLAIHPVGIDSRVKHMNSLLSVGTNDVRMVAIHGMGGIGKTTIAKAVFNHLFQSFECKSFLANVRDNFKQRERQILLQKQLLWDILNTKVREVHNVDRGIETNYLRSVVTRRAPEKIALVQEVELSYITTRQEDLLKKIQVNNKYEIEKWNENESLELFSWHAFGRTDPIEGFAQLAEDVVGYCNGLPLALEVLGSRLREFEKEVEWESELKKWKKNPPSKIQDTLEISYNALDPNEQETFLDIACFFIGMDKDYVTKILDGCDFFATSSIGVLSRRCLLTIDENKLMMHNLLRDMGREINFRESVENHVKPRRLWNHEDALDVLENSTGTEQIECLALNMEGPVKVDSKAEAFAAMHNLRLLQLNYVNITGGYEHISKKLRWLCWHGFPLKSIPNNFNQEKLVVIDMQYSSLKQVTKGNKVLEKLKILDLSHSHLLTRITIDFSTLPNLEELILEDCKGLTTIDKSIGSLDKLVLLNLRECANLRNLPRSICMLKSLKILGLNGLKFDKFPKEMGLNVLLGKRTGFKKAPSKSWFSLFSPRLSPKDITDSMSLTPNSLVGLTALTSLTLLDCNLPEGAIPKDIWSLSFLERLDLGLNKFYSLPPGISRLSNLQALFVGGCANLTSLPELPSSLNFLAASDTSLERLPDISHISEALTIYLFDCFKLTEFPFTENLLQRWYERKTWPTAFDDVSFPCYEIPDWFINQRMGNVLSFQVPPDFIMMEGFILCFIYALNVDFHIKRGGLFPKPFDYTVSVKNVTKGFSVSCGRYLFPFYPETDHLSLGYVRLGEFKVDIGDEVEFVIRARCELTVKKCGVIPVLVPRLNIEEVNDDDDDDDDNHDESARPSGHYSSYNENNIEEVNDDDEDKHAESARPSVHYWSYDENHTLSTYVIMLAPQSTYSRRVPLLRDPDEADDGDDDRGDDLIFDEAKAKENNDDPFELDGEQ